MVSAKLLVFFSCTIAVALAIPSQKSFGAGSTNLSGSDLKKATKTLKHSLSTLAAGEGPNYKMSEINSVAKQTVAGTLYKYNVDLIDENKSVKTCNVNIWSRPWLQNGIEVTFICPDEEVVVRRHSA